MNIPIDVVIRLLLIELRSAPVYYCLIGETEVQDDLPWYHDIYQFLISDTYPEVANAKDRRALRNLATRFVIVVIRLLLIELRSAPAYCCLIGETEVQDDLPWYHDIYQFLISDTYPEVATAKDRRALRNLATRFVICGDTLYRR